MGNLRASKRRIGAECYLCRCSNMSVDQLTHEIVHGPGRVLWGMTLCAHHQSEKEQRRDEREDRLNEAGLGVVFAERAGLFGGPIDGTDGSVYLLPTFASAEMN